MSARSYFVALLAVSSQQAAANPSDFDRFAGLTPIFADADKVTSDRATAALLWCKKTQRSDAEIRCSKLVVDRFENELSRLLHSHEQAAQEIDALQARYCAERNGLEDSSPACGAPTWSDRLTEIQTSWTAYRDVQCEWVAQTGRSRRQQEFIQNSCLVRLTVQRMQTLAQFRVPSWEHAENE